MRMSCVLKNFKPVSDQFEKFKPKKKKKNHNKRMEYRVITRVIVGEKLPSPKRNFYHYSI